LIERLSGLFNRSDESIFLFHKYGKINKEHFIKRLGVFVLIELKKDFWLMPLFAFITFLFAAGLHNSLLWFLFNLCSLCILLTLVYRWRDWLNLDIDRTIDSKQTSIEAGTDLKVNIRTQIFGILPWPWIEVKDIIPKSIAQRAEHIMPKNFIWIRKGISRQSEYFIPKVRRGVHFWDSLEYKSGDVLGFISCIGHISKPIRLIVYPNTIDLSIDVIIPKYAYGSIKTKRTFEFDKEQPVGIRDYQPGDSFSHIAWKSTAKMGKLQSKEFEPLINDSFHVVLDCSANAWGKDFNSSFEEAIIAVASLVKALIAAHIPVTFHSNTNMKLRNMYIGDSINYYDFLLQMAFINSDSSESITAMLYKEKFAHSGNMILVTSHRGIELEKIIKQKAIKGNFNTLLLVNKNFTKNYNVIKETAFYRRIMISKAEDLIQNINRG